MHKVSEIETTVLSEENYSVVVFNFKATHMEQQYGRFLSHMVNRILQHWNVLLPLMHMLVRLIGEFIVYSFSSLSTGCAYKCGGLKSLRTCNFLIFTFMKTLYTSCGNSVLWCPSGNSDKLISMDEQNLVFWSLDSSKKSAEVIVATTRERINPLNHFCLLCF